MSISALSGSSFAAIAAGARAELKAMTLSRALQAAGVLVTRCVRSTHRYLIYTHHAFPAFSSIITSLRKTTAFSRPSSKDMSGSSCSMLSTPS